MVQVQDYRSTGTRLQKYRYMTTEVQVQDSRSTGTRLQKYRSNDCRYGGDWTEDCLDLLMAALGPNLTSLALNYVEGMDLGALAHISTCCQVTWGPGRYLHPLPGPGQSQVGGPGRQDGGGGGARHGAGREDWGGGGREVTGQCSTALCNDTDYSSQRTAKINLDLKARLRRSARF